MHMADALVSPAVAGSLYACSAAVAVYSVRKVRLENDPKKIPLMGVMGAFVFAAQMINFTIPGTGSSGHLCGGMMLSALLGPYAGFLTMIGILLIQSLLFADGGLLALGCNVWNMAFYGCFIGTFLIWRPMMRRGMSKKKIALASVLGCVLTLQLGSFSVTLETLLSGITDLPFPIFAATMQPIHLAIGLVEGLITAAVLMFIYEARPELLTGGEIPEGKKGRFSFRKTLLILLLATVLVGGGISLLASQNPDGLEWSMEKVAGTTEPEADGAAYDQAVAVQEATAILPDYSFRDSGSDSGTVISGILGSLAVLAICVISCSLILFLRKKKRHEQS